MKKGLLTLAAAIPMVLAGQAMAADKVLTISSWAAPVHTMNKHVFPWMISELEKCSGGSLSAKVEYGLASPPAQYDTVRDGVADIGWIVYGYTPGKFEATKIVEMPGNTGNAHAFKRPSGPILFHSVIHGSTQRLLCCTNFVR